jgi:hypothetical protein
MAWIESHQEIARHPKTRRLARQLEVSIPSVIGHLHLLWWWALDYADDGDLGRYTDDDIADGMLYEGDAAWLVESLTDAGFLDADRRIHDWDDFAGRLVQRRKANAERMRESRATHVQRTCNARAGATEQNRTKQNRTKTLTPPTPLVTEPDDPVAPTALPAEPPVKPVIERKPTTKPTKGDDLPGNPRVAAVIDGLRAADVEYLLSPADMKAIKLSAQVPPDRIVAVKSGRWGDDWFRDNLSVPLVIGRINGMPNGKNGHARAGPGRTSRKADGDDLSDFDGLMDTTAHLLEEAG